MGGINTDLDMHLKLTVFHLVMIQLHSNMPLVLSIEQNQRTQ